MNNNFFSDKIRFFFRCFVAISMIVIFFGLLYFQYAIYTPKWETYLEPNSFAGFLNGFFVFHNSLIFTFKEIFFDNHSWYIFDYYNPNSDYVRGFAVGAILQVIFIIFGYSRKSTK